MESRGTWVVGDLSLSRFGGAMEEETRMERWKREWEVRK